MPIPAIPATRPQGIPDQALKVWWRLLPDDGYNSDNIALVLRYSLWIHSPAMRAARTLAGALIDLLIALQQLIFRRAASMFEGDGPFRGFSEAVVIDIETTGLDPKSHRIISIGAIKVDFRCFIAHGGGELKTYQCLINPERRIPASASAIHGIIDADVAGEERFADAFGGLRDFVADRPLIAHNCRFDRSFIDAECRRAFKPPLGTGWYCTMERMCFYERARGKLRDRISLDEAAQLMCIPGRAGAHHNALEDALITAQLAAGIYMLDNKLERGTARTRPALPNIVPLTLAASTTTSPGLSSLPIGSPRHSGQDEPRFSRSSSWFSWLKKLIASAAAR